MIDATLDVPTALPPTLRASAARIDVAGRPLVTQLEARSNAARLGLVGDWSPLFRLLAGEAALVAGSLDIGGAPVPLGVRRGQVGVAMLVPPLPPAWSCEQLLRSSLELCGATRRDAERRAFQTLDALGLMGLAGRRLGHLALSERRTLLLAHAASSDPQVLCAEMPLAGLDTAGQELVLAVLERACSGRRSIVALGDTASCSAGRALAASSDEVLRASAGVVVVESGETATSGRVTVTVCRNHHAFAAALAERGLAAHATHEAGILTSLTSVHAGPAWRYLVVLSDGSTASVLDAALDTDAGLLELTPA